MFRKLNDILVTREKLKVFLIFVGAVCMSFLGALGLVPILPFIQLAADTSAAWEHETAQKILVHFEFVTEENVLIYAGIGVMLFIFLAAASNLTFRWLMVRFTWGIANTMALRLLENYCYSPYDIFLTKDTKKMSYKILNEITTLATGILLPIAHLFASIFTALFLFIVLLYFDWEISLIVFASVGTTYLVIFFLFRNAVENLGDMRIEHATNRFAAAEEILQNIKTTKVFGKENFFLQKFSFSSHKFTEAQSKAPLYMDSPKAIIETITFGIIIAVVLYLELFRGGILPYIPKLSLFAIAGYRLLPALQQCYFSLTDIKYHLPGLDKLHADILELPFEIAKENKEKEPPESITYNQEISLRDVHFKYPASDEYLFEGINLSIKKGQRVAFIGTTGSGKSTLVDLIMGLLTPREGGVYIDNHKLVKSDWQAWRSRVGYVPQEIFLINESVQENIAFGLDDSEVSREAMLEAARIADIKHFVETELEQGFDTQVGERGIRLSGGQKQRIGLARALYNKPDVLVLDEATSALDNKTEKSIMDSIDKLPLDLTIIMVAHRLTTVKDCDVIYVLNRGEIADQGSYDELKFRCKLFNEMEEQHQTAQ